MPKNNIDINLKYFIAKNSNYPLIFQQVIKCLLVEDLALTLLVADGSEWLLMKVGVVSQTS